MALALKIGQTLYDNRRRSFCHIEKIQDENPELTNFHYPEGTKVVYIVGPNGSWSNWIADYRASCLRDLAYVMFYANIIQNLSDVRLLEIRQMWRQWILANAAARAYEQRTNEREYCPECGQHKALHTYISSSATEPPEMECRPEDKPDIERGDWKDRWNERYQYIGWDIDNTKG
jgi:hypothetical protein